MRVATTISHRFQRGRIGLPGAECEDTGCEGSESEDTEAADTEPEFGDDWSDGIILASPHLTEEAGTETCPTKTCSPALITRPYAPVICLANRACA